MSTPKKHENFPITADGLMRYSRGHLFHTHRIHKLLEKNAEMKQKAKEARKIKPKINTNKVKPIGGAKNGGERVIRSATIGSVGILVWNVFESQERVSFHKKSSKNTYRSRRMQPFPVMFCIRNSSVRVSWTIVLQGPAPRVLIVTNRPRPKTYYPTEIMRFNRRREARRKRRLNSKRVILPKLKKSLVSGTVCIVLAGCQVGKRVVFLKQMERSGLALVTGPYRLNGCPLRRVNQNHLLATDTRIKLDDIKLPETVNDDMFARHDKKQKELRRKNRKKFDRSSNQKKVVESVFGEGSEGAVHVKFRLPDDVRQKRMVVQKEVDKQVLDALTKQYGNVMKGYLASKFHIDNGVYPHRLKF
ncbi:hypothetical protein ACOME3_003387 [Neoechinorhynchus agilis]